MTEVVSSAKGRSRAVVIMALGLTQIMAWGSSYYLIAVLAKPIAADTGWPLTWVVSGLSVGLLAAGLISQKVGRVIHRRGGRPVLATSAVLLASGLAGLALAPNLPCYLLAWVVIGFGMGTGLYDPAFATLGRLYGQEARRAITTLTLWGGFASTVCWPLSAILVEHLGWRGACLAYAAIQVMFSLPTLLVAIPQAERGERITTPAARSGDGEQAASSAQRRELRLFVRLATVLTVASSVMSVISVHLLTILQTTRGLDLAAAVAFGAMVGPSQVGARVVEMAFGRRYHPIWTLISSVALVALGLGLLTLGFPVIAVALVFYGAGNGLSSIARGSLPLALFGPSRYAIWVGRVAAPTLIAGAISPAIGALLIDSLGPAYTLCIISALAALNILGALTLVRQRRTISSGSGPRS